MLNTELHQPERCTCRRWSLPTGAHHRSQQQLIPRSVCHLGNSVGSGRWTVPPPDHQHPTGPSFHLCGARQGGGVGRLQSSGGLHQQLQFRHVPVQLHYHNTQNLYRHCDCQPPNPIVTSTEVMHEKPEVPEVYNLGSKRTFIYIKNNYVCMRFHKTSTMHRSQ